MKNSVTRLVLSLGAWPSVPLFFTLRPGYGDIVAIVSALGYALGFLLAARRHNRQSALDSAVLFFWAFWLAGFALAPAKAGQYLNHRKRSAAPNLLCHRPFHVAPVQFKRLFLASPALLNAYKPENLPIFRLPGERI